MKTISRAQGNVTFALPDTASEPVDIAAKKTRKRRGSRSTVEPMAQEIDSLLEALAGDAAKAAAGTEYQVLDRFSLDLGPGKKQPIRRGPKPPSDEMKIDISLEPDEGAVLLIEQEGTYEWHFPEKSVLQRAPKRRGRQGSVERKTVVFRVPIGEGAPPRQRRGITRAHRGPITNFIKGKIKGFILKFAARKVVGALSRRLEKGVLPGPVIITSSGDVSGWEHRADYLSIDLPRDRPARILLLVHGTFSSTLGSYGALTAQPAGQRFLGLALDHYDAVLGYDHYTLAETPAQNAEALFEDLLKLQGRSRGMEIDAISFSRGGLVYRYLTEQILPFEATQMAFRKSIFVACTNAGTELANDDNWKHLVDFYTNMVAGTSRLLGTVTGAKLPAEIFNQAVQAIGSLVKYMAQDAVEDNAVPGLAAMEPDGRFVAAMNATPPSRTRPGANAYYAMGSNFEPDRNTSAGELGKRLVLKVADGFVDKLMGEINDLVVDTDSMFIVDPVPSARLLEKLPFGENGEIYHTVYFNQPQVARQCSHWLGLVQASKESDIRAPRTWWKEAVSDDFQIVSSRSSVAEALDSLERSDSRFVVIERARKGEVQHYGMPAPEIRDRMRSHSNKKAILEEMLDLKGSQARGIALDKALEAPNAAAFNRRFGSPASRHKRVVFSDRGPVGVVAPPEILSSGELVEEAASAARRPLPRRKMAAKKKSSRKRSPVRRGRGGDRAAMTAGAREAGARESVPKMAEPQSVWCNAHADMEEEAVIGKKTSVEVTLSRDEIIRQSGVFGGGKVQEDKDLIVQVNPRKNCKVSGDSRAEVPVPAAGAETPLYFDVIPVHEGIGRVDVIIRQGNRPIVTLTLNPRFVAKRTTDAIETLTANAELHPVDSRRELPDVLHIHEGEMGSKKTLIFQFESRTLNQRLHCVSEPFKDSGAREKYVRDLYRQIESFWADSELEYESFMSKIRARGVEIFETLMPKELQKVLWDNRDNLKTIQVFSEEPFIPWELAYIKEPGKKARKDSYFLAEKGLVRWHTDSGVAGKYPPVKLRLREGRAAYVIPDYPPSSGYQLAGAQQEREMLEAVFSARPITPTSLAVEEALATPGAYDIIHFACHGLANSEEIWNAGLMMKGKIKAGGYEPDNYMASQVVAYADLQEDDEPGPVVFLNACQVGRKGYNLTGTGGFARAFVSSGAGAFVSTHWSVGDEPAFDFSETLYKELLDGKNMMTAVAAARKAAKNKEEITWLAYVVYADPYARLIQEKDVARRSLS